ncbi:MAG: ribonuclease H family protein [Lachnoclostridium sp.]|nr:ribonuclease H family protein [Lachnoclostridium sp.]
MKRKFYVVWNGYATGVFDSWEECQLQTKGYPEAKYKSFDTQEEAIAAYRGDPADHIHIIRNIATHSAPVINYAAFPEIRLDAIAVDAACSKNPGPVEYRGVWVGSGWQAFHVGPLQDGTNNIGEFLALIHALALFEREGRPDIPIYTDSRTARSWLRNRKVKTTLQPTPSNTRIREILARAIHWMNTHDVLNPILTWNTEAWGEIPADFGRK